MMKLLKWKWVALAAAATTALAGAQAPDQDGGGGQPGRAGIRIRALAFDVNAKFPEEMFAHAIPNDGKDPGIPIAIKNFLNDQADVVPANQRQWVLTNDDDPASLADPANVLVKLRIPDRMRSGIFLVLPGTGRPGDPPYRMLPIDDSRREFPPGSLKIMNLSPREVRIKLEDKVFNFKSGETQVVKDMPVGERNQANMLAFERTEEGWRRIGAGKWPHPGRKRVLEILFENVRNKVVEMRDYKDIAEAP